MNPELRLTVMKNKTEAGMAIYIVLQKTSATENISLPIIESSLSNKSIDRNKQTIRWSNLYYDHKLVGEKEYKRDQLLKESDAEGQNEKILGDI